MYSVLHLPYKVSPSLVHTVEDQIFIVYNFSEPQVIQNACATQAILSVLLNSELEQAKEGEGSWQLGPTLSSFREFCSSFDAGMKGLTLSNSDEIRAVHNSFSRQNLFEFDQRMASKARQFHR